jgi:hypothetical protein
MNEQPLKRGWFYWFIALFTATQLPISALVLLDFVLHPLEPDYSYHSVVFRLFWTLVIVPLVLFVALLVIRRAPHNVTGLFLLLWVTIIIGGTVRDDTYVRNLSGALFGWAGIWFVPLYFPDGHAYPRRFERYIRWLCVGLMLSLVAWVLMSPPPNPLLVPGLERFHPLAVAAERGLLFALQLIILPSMIARYRGSDQRTRQQLKWLGWVFLGIIVCVIPAVISGFVTRDRSTFNPLEQVVAFLFSLLITLAPFLAISNALLRYRLYDIDIIIRKTLMYSTISAILAGVYFGGVALMQSGFVALTGQESPLAVVASTLAIAALFTPVRRRVQAVVDRRFYRRKYDAEKTVDAFARAVRDEVDVDRLRGELVRVVEETMQPEHVSLWVRTR